MYESSSELEKLGDLRPFGLKPNKGQPLCEIKTQSSNMLLIGLKTLSSVAYQMTNIVSKKLK